MNIFGLNFCTIELYSFPYCSVAVISLVCRLCDATSCRMAADRLTCAHCNKLEAAAANVFSSDCVHKSRDDEPIVCCPDDNQCFCCSRPTESTPVDKSIEAAEMPLNRDALIKKQKMAGCMFTSCRSCNGRLRSPPAFVQDAARKCEGGETPNGGGGASSRRQAAVDPQAARSAYGPLLRGGGSDGGVHARAHARVEAPW